MLGDSITAYVDWDELLGRTDIAGRGIGGDTTAGFLNRLHYVFKLNPRICFIMGGINDISRGIPVDEIFENYKNIITNLKNHNIIPIIQSTLYTSNPIWNREVEKLDELLKRYAEDNNVDYIDLNGFLSEERALKEEYTYDGVHLLGNAYEVWRQAIKNILKKHSL